MVKLRYVRDACDVSGRDGGSTEEFWDGCNKESGLCTCCMSGLINCDKNE